MDLEHETRVVERRESFPGLRDVWGPANGAIAKKY